MMHRPFRHGASGRKAAPWDAKPRLVVTEVCEHPFRDHARVSIADIASYLLPELNVACEPLFSGPSLRELHATAVTVDDELNVRPLAAVLQFDSQVKNRFHEELARYRAIFVNGLVDTFVSPRFDLEPKICHVNLRFRLGSQWAETHAVIRG